MAKKMMGVLLVVLMVAGVAFAEPTSPSNAVLTLNGAVGEKLYHKFADSALTVNNFLIDSSGSDTVAKTVDMTTLGAQSLGYYNLYTNYGGEITVTATATGFTSATVAESKIGYTFNGVVVGKDDTAKTITDFMTVTGTGTRVQSVAMSLTLDPVSLGAATAANNYVAAVTIAVSAS